MYCCILHLPYEQHVKAQLSTTTAAIRTVRAGTAGYVVYGCQLHASAALSPDHLNRIVCGFQFLFALFDSTKASFPCLESESN
jgi:hypothetical protein